MRSILFLFSVCVISAACERGVIYQNNQNIPEEKWPIGQQFINVVEINDSLNYHQISFNIRHNKNYAYRNLYLFLYTQYPDNKVRKDTIELPLATKEGRWYGDGSGIISTEIALNRKIRFNKAGKHTFVIEHAMREDTLLHVADVGIKIKKLSE